MDLQLRGKVVLVTGGSAGLGKATARALAREVDGAAWTQGLQLKFMGYLRCLKAALPIVLMMARDAV